MKPIWSCVGKLTKFAHRNSCYQMKQSLPLLVNAEKPMVSRMKIENGMMNYKSSQAILRSSSLRKFGFYFNKVLYPLIV